MPKVKAIFNPQAHRGDNYSRRDIIRRILEAAASDASLRGVPYQLDWVSTEYPGHATELARQAAEERHDVIVSIGGDGTVHEVINGLMQVEADRRPRLGILPTGTGNDLAANFGIPLDLAKAAQGLFQNTARPLDVGHVSDSGQNQEYWGNTLGFGFSGAVTVVARRSTTFLRGFALYLYVVIKTILFHKRDHDILISVDGQEPVGRSISMVNICNGRAEGGGFPVAPDALMDDGLLTYTLMQRMSRLQLFYFLPIVLGARHLEHTDRFEFGTARKFRITSRQPLDVHVDGELFCADRGDLRQIDVTIIPSALQVLCWA
jgi:diacylglycerol kinase (ATP)